MCYTIVLVGCQGKLTTGFAGIKHLPELSLDLVDCVLGYCPGFRWPVVHKVQQCRRVAEVRPTHAHDPLCKLEPVSASAMCADVVFEREDLLLALLHWGIVETCHCHVVLKEGFNIRA
jgi:hypothetical protein